MNTKHDFWNFEKDQAEYSILISHFNKVKKYLLVGINTKRCPQDTHDANRNGIVIM